MAITETPWIKMAEHLNREDYERISALQTECVHADNISLKLELDYKLGIAEETNKRAGIKDINEFMYYAGDQLIGYIGICDFGGGETLEITGMVHPDYRRQGVSTKLWELVLKECERRRPGSILILCDRKSFFGQSFIKKTGAIYEHSEYEMYLRHDYQEPEEKLLCGIALRKATNPDAHEIARMNDIFFADERDTSDTQKERAITEEDIPLPEEEEKRGMTIYMAYKNDQLIGKVNLETSTETGGIYGLGILPEYRGKGFGRALLLLAVKKLKDENKKDIMLQVLTQNARALRLYQSAGFEETSIMDYYERKP